jgi:hypothetical protein
MSLKTLQEIVAATKASVHCLTPQAARELMADNSDALVIDVREPDEVSEKRPSGTINIPRGVLEMKITEHTTDPDQRARCPGCRGSGEHGVPQRQYY